jgi:hypothetical protein
MTERKWTGPIEWWVGSADGKPYTIDEPTRLVLESAIKNGVNVGYDRGFAAGLQVVRRKVVERDAQGRISAIVEVVDGNAIESASQPLTVAPGSAVKQPFGFQSRTERGDER